jgi:surface rod structure-forming protein G
MKRIISLLLIIFTVSAPAVGAHSGRTDSSGGHNCNVGSCAGTYHYHNGGGPVAPSTPKFTAPRVPVVRTQQVTRDEVIQFKTIPKYDFREYPEYSLRKQAGAVGKKVITTIITFTDGKETGRTDSKSEVVVQPTDEIFIKGGRSRSTARIYGIAQAKKGIFSSNKDKYNVWGKYEANKEVYLTVEGKKTKTVKTNADGWFTFENIKIPGTEAWLQINSQKKSVSEKTKVYLQSKKIITEYDLIHNKR